MTLFKQWFFTFFVILLLLAPLGTVASQTDEIEPEPTATPDVTPEPTPEATVIVLPPDTPPDTSAGDLDQLLKIALLIIGGVLSGSLLTIGGVIALVRTIRSDPEKMALIERLYDSRPDPERSRIRGGVEVAKEIVTAADEATDGIPLSQKPR